MRSRFICLWFEEEGSALLIDQRTSLATSGEKERLGASGWRLIVSASTPAGSEPSTASDSGNGTVREVFPWPCHAADLLLLADLAPSARLIVYDFGIASDAKSHPGNGSIARFECFDFDPSVRLGESADAAWVVSRSPAPDLAGKAWFHGASRLEPFPGAHRERGPRPGAAARAGERAAVERLIQAAVADQGLERLDATFWISPMAGERVGPAVISGFDIQAPTLHVSVSFADGEHGEAQPMLRLSCRGGLALSALAGRLELVQWRRNARAHGLADVRVVPVRLRGEGGADWDTAACTDPARHGDVFGIICPDGSLRIVGDGPGDTPGGGPAAPARPPSTAFPGLFVRRETSAEPASHDRRLLESGALARLHDVLLARSAPQGAPSQALLATLKSEIASSIEKVAFATSYLVGPDLGPRARLHLSKAFEKPQLLRLDRMAYAAACPGRLAHLVELERVGSPPPCRLPAGAAAAEALAAVVWQIVLPAHALDDSGRSDAAVAAAQISSSLGRELLLNPSVLRALLAPSTRQRVLAEVDAQSRAHGR
jgi:hypothetical protein